MKIARSIRSIRKYRRCSAITTVRPSFLIWIICWRKVSIASASKLAVGSSNTKMDGFMAYTEANARLCFSPPDIEKILRPSSDCIFRAETVASYRSLIFLGSTPAFSKPKVISLSESILKNCDFGFWNTEPTCSAKRYISV